MDLGSLGEAKADTLDRRVRRTRRLLAEALISLVLEKGYEDVTIRAVTGRADVGYATFFRHYSGKDALLGDVLEVVLEDLLGLLRPLRADGDPVAVGESLFRYVAENAEVCRVLLGDGASTALVRRMVEAGTRDALRQNTPLAGSPVPAEIAAHHLVASSVALVRWWLDRGMPHSPERMGEIYYELIVQPTRTVAFEA